MSLFSLSNYKGSAKDTTLIVDVGTASVSVGLILKKTAVSKIHYVAKHETAIDSFSDFQNFFTHLLHGIQILIDDLIKSKTFRVPEKIICFLPTLLHFSEIRTARIVYQKDKTITAKMITDIASVEVEDFRKNAQLVHKGLKAGELEILEQQIIGIKLNGYGIENPIGKSAKEVTISIFVSYTSSEALKKISKLFHTAFHTTSIEFHAGIYAVFKAIQSRQGNNSPFSILNAGGESSDVVIAGEGNITHMFTYPFGYRTLIKKLSDHLNSTPSETKTLLQLYVSSTMPKKTSMRIDTALTDMRELWLAQLVSVVSERGLMRRMPQRMLLFGNSIFVELMMKWLAEKERSLMFCNCPLKIIKVSEGMFTGAYSGNLPQHEYIPLIAKIIFTSKFSKVQ